MNTPPNPFVDFIKILEQFKLPGLDMASVIEARRKDIDALTEANKTAYEGMRTLVQKQTEILVQTMQDMQAAAQQSLAGGAMGGDMAKQQELIQGALHKAFQNMQELAEIARKAQLDATRTITERVKANTDEFKARIQQK